MGFLDIAERTVQDTANLATTTGLDVIGLSRFLPGPAIERGNSLVIATGEELAKHDLPEDEEKLYSKQHDT